MRIVNFIDNQFLICNNVFLNITKNITMEYILLVTQLITIILLIKFNKRVKVLNGQNNYLEAKNKNVINESKKLKRKLIEYKGEAND